MFVSLARVCVVYVVKEVTSFRDARSINWAWHVKERALEKRSSRKNVNCCIPQHRNSIKMMQESLKSKYNKLLSFIHEEVII